MNGNPQETGPNLAKVCCHCCDSGGGKGAYFFYKNMFLLF